MVKRILSPLSFQFSDIDFRAVIIIVICFSRKNISLKLKASEWYLLLQMKFHRHFSNKFVSFYMQWIQTSILNKSRRWSLNLKSTYLISGPQHLQCSPKIWKEADCFNEKDVMSCTGNVTVNNSENEITRVRILTEFIAFPFAQILHGLNRWIDYALLPWGATRLGERKLWIKNKKTVWRGMGL